MSRFVLSSLFKGDGAQARVARGTVFIGLAFGGNKMMRLASNLILTRLLFPEAFGLMALVGVFTAGLEMLSDTGIKSSIIQSKRGHDPVYLNTAWTVQIGRGVLLWLLACALAGPAARFYEEPMLAQLLPVAALSLLIQGFVSTKEATANKSLRLGKLTIIGLFCELLGLLLNITLAILLQSVWALVFGTLLQYFVRTILTHVALPGVRNRIWFDREVFWDLFHFGKYIFIGTAAAFVIQQGDKAILGRYVSLTELAVYHIGWMLATVAMAFNRVFARRILFPLYSEKRIDEAPENRHKIARLRYFVTGGILMISFALALAGDSLVQFLYLPAYHLAGPILVLVALTSMPTIIVAAYTEFLLSVGNSRAFTITLIVTAFLQMVFLLIGVQAYGLLGAIAAPPLAILLAYPLLVWMVRPYGVWDPRHDGLYALLAVVACVVSLSLHEDAVARVLAGVV